MSHSVFDSEIVERLITHEMRANGIVDYEDGNLIYELDRGREFRIEVKATMLPPKPVRFQESIQRAWD